MGIAAAPRAPAHRAPRRSAIRSIAPGAIAFALLSAPDGMAQSGERALLVSVEAPDAPMLFAEFAREKGHGGEATEMACRALAEGLLLCLWSEEGGARRAMSRADLTVSALDFGAAEALAVAALVENPLRPQEVEGGGTWWAAESDDGRIAGVFLKPDWIEAIGPRPVLCAPARGVVMAWSAGDADLDMMVAVGARRAFDTFPEPVSPICLAWEGGYWRSWGEAKPPTHPAATPPGVGK